MSITLISTDYFIIPELLKLKAYDNILILSDEIIQSRENNFITNDVKALLNEYKILNDTSIIVRKSICVIIDNLTEELINNRDYRYLIKNRASHNIDWLFYNISDIMKINHEYIDYFILGRTNKANANIQILAYTIGRTNINGEKLLEKYNKLLERNDFLIINLNFDFLKGMRFNNLELRKILKN